MKRIVLGFSGSLAAAAAVPWLRDRHAAEVITVTIDFGQGEELAAVRERALALGAVRAHVIDAREELTRDYLLPALQAGAIMEGHALVHPLIASRLIDVARMESASAIAHAAASGTTADTIVRAAAAALASSLDVIAPASAWTLSEMELSELVRTSGVHAVPSKGPRVEASLWGRRIQAPRGMPIPEDVFTLTRAHDECPEYPAFVDIEFVGGVPVAANGVEMPMGELIESLETIAGAHGVGRSVAGEFASEMPAAYVLGIAHGELAEGVLGGDLQAVRAKLAAIYSGVLSGGRWFSDIRDAIDVVTRIIQPRVSGRVKLRLLKGLCSVIACEPRQSAGARSPKAVA